MKYLLTCTALLYCTCFAVGQNKGTIINGKVISFEESLPLEGIAVSIKGTNKVTGTMADGSFTLTIYPEDKTLILSGAAYQTTEVAITSKTDYEIALPLKNNFADYLFLLLSPVSADVKEISASTTHLLLCSK